MAYRDIVTDWDGALSKLVSSMRVMISPVCGEPQALLGSLVERADNFSGLTLMSGLLLDDYAFLDQRYRDNFNYITTHVVPRTREPLARREIDFVSVRHFDMPRVFGRGGPLQADAVLVQTSPPGPDGMVSFGPSTSYPLSLARQAKLVIAQVNNFCPRTMGDSLFPADRLSAAVECDEELIEYRTPDVGAVERRIAEHVLELIPQGATLQVGIGNVPEAVLECLPAGLELSMVGMGLDATVDLFERGVINRPVQSIELMGTRKLWDFADSNPMLKMQVSDQGHHPWLLGRAPGFVSLNSAVEVDLSGQVNAESIGDKQISGLGGQFDFVEAAHWSEGGKSIFAFPSTSGGGRFSRIVSRLGSGARVSTPRYMVNYVVTEYGVADLWGKTLGQRAQALMEIAHPRFQADLENELRKI